MIKNGESFYQKAITHKKMIIILTVPLVSTILIGGIFLWYFRHLSHDMAKAFLEKQVLGQKREVDFFFQDKLREIRLISQFFTPDILKKEPFLQELLEQLNHEQKEVFLNITLFDDQGNPVAYAGLSQLKDPHPMENDRFKKIAESQYVISDIIQNPPGSPYCMIATGVQRKDGSHWILQSAIDVGFIHWQLRNSGANKQITAFILNQEGQFQSHQPDTLALPRAQYLDFFSINQNIAIFYNDNILIGTSLLKNNNWLLILEQNIHEVFPWLNYTRNLIILIIILNALSIAIIFFWLLKESKGESERIDSRKEIISQEIIESGNLASIGELATGIAHEINNPVAIMIEEAGWIQDLIHEGIDNEDNKTEFLRALKQIETQGRRCKEITRKLLSFGRKTDSRTQMLQLNEIIEEVVTLSSEKARKGNVTIHTQLDPHLPEIMASVTEMQQVLVNLVDNALDAMEKKGDRIDVISTCNENQIIMTVADNGPGIPAIIMNRLFDPFFSTKPVGKGSGLGLSICYGIIKKMGGKIDFKSMLGEGSTFRIVLPLGDHLE